MGMQWPPLSHWQDFEELCERLFHAEHAPTQCFRYGRSGQAQHGVDIAARRATSDHWVGIQCKLKTELLGSALTEQQLIDAYETSKKFGHGLEKLIVATTSPTDRAVQDLSMHISNSFQARYPVEVLSWNQIEDLLDRHPGVAKRFYPEHFDTGVRLVETHDGALHTTLTREHWERDLERFLRCDLFVAAAGGQAAVVAAIASELIDNALAPSKGGAKRVQLGLSEAVMSIRDDGKAFDPVRDAAPLQPSMMGLRSVREAVLRSAGALQLTYTAADASRTRFNENRIQIVSAAQALLDTCRATGPTYFLLSREAAFRFARELAIPAECEEFTLRLLGDTFMNFSSTAQLVESLLQRLQGRRLRIRVGQDCQLFLEALQLQAFGHPDVIVEAV